MKNGERKAHVLLIRFGAATGDVEILNITADVMKKLLLKFLRSEDGPTSVEYAVMLAMLLGVCIASIGLVGQETSDSVQESSDRIETAFTESGVGDL